MRSIWSSHPTSVRCSRSSNLQFPICSSLKDLVNLLASGNVPVLVSKYLAGGSLTALIKNKADLYLDIRPIAVAWGSFASFGGEMSSCSGKV